MYLHSTKIRIRYSETDRMGYVYYGNYAQFFEIGRVEMLRSLGVSYKQMEDEGIMLPVIDFSVRYLKPAFYDDEITIETVIRKIPSAKIHFEYTIYNAEKMALTKAETTLVFVKKETMKPTSPPTELVEALEKEFSKEETN